MAPKTLESKVLVACPIWEFDKPFVDEFIKQFDNSYDILFVENTPNTNSFYDYLNKKYDNYVSPNDTEDEVYRTVHVERYDWKPKKEHFCNMMAVCSNIIRQYAIDNDYTHWFSTGADTLVPANTIKKLLTHNKDIVGIPTNFNKPDFDKPAVWVKPEFIYLTPDNKFVMNVCDWSDIPNKLFRVTAVGGTALYNRSVLEKCEFYSHPDYIWGEDMWWFVETNRKGFEWWCDGTLRANNRCVDLPRKSQIRRDQEEAYYKRVWSKRNKGTYADMLTNFINRPA